MSSVRKKDQSEHRFTVLDKCLDLYDHTTTVTANPKFQQCASLTDRINDEAAMIYHLCRCANEDLDARNKQEAAMRMNLQAEALGHCKWLKTYIMLAQRKLHLRAKKAAHWTGLVNTAMDYIKKWQVSEKRRYKETHGL